MHVARKQRCSSRPGRSGACRGASCHVVGVQHMASGLGAAGGLTPPPHCPASAHTGEHVLHAARCAAKQGSSGTYHRASDGHAHSRASRDGTTAGHHRGHTASKGAEHRALGVGGGREKTNQPPTFRQPVARGIARLNFGTKSRPASVAGCQRRSMRSEREP